jgi:hypothetical protein
MTLYLVEIIVKIQSMIRKTFAFRKVSKIMSKFGYYLGISAGL